MTRLRPFLAVAATVALTPLLAPILAPAPVSAAPDEATLAPTMLVLDASGSMTESDPSGGTRMAAAKAAAPC